MHQLMHTGFQVWKRSERKGSRAAWLGHCLGLREALYRIHVTVPYTCRCTVYMSLFAAHMSDCHKLGDRPRQPSQPTTADLRTCATLFARWTLFGPDPGQTLALEWRGSVIIVSLLVQALLTVKMKSMWCSSVPCMRTVETSRLLNCSLRTIFKSSLEHRDKKMLIDFFWNIPKVRRGKALL